MTTTIRAYSAGRRRTVSYEVDSWIGEMALGRRLRQLGWTEIVVEHSRARWTRRLANWIGSGVRESGGGEDPSGGVRVPTP